MLTIETLEREQRWLRRQLNALQFELRLRRFARTLKYNADQPRVPAGSADGGQWTDGSGGGERSQRVRLAANEKIPLGPHIFGAIGAEVAKRLIAAYKRENGLYDLFQNSSHTVAVTNFNGVNIFGLNSSAPTYSREDRVAAEQMRDRLIELHPDVMATGNIGQRPNDALFHAETTVLLRAARQNGGTLAGQELEVRVDNPMCRSCDTVLPLVSTQLGNPTVTFVAPNGDAALLKNGVWARGRK